MPWEKVNNESEEMYENTYTHQYTRKVRPSELLDEIKRINDEISRLEEQKAKIQSDYDEIMIVKGSKNGENNG